MSEHNPRAFIDMNGGYQSHREGAEKLAHDAWVKSNTWGLTRDDFIRLSYFHGDLEGGSDGLGPVNGSEDRPHDAVYIGANGAVLSRSMVSYWLADCNSFIHGYKTAVENSATQPPQDERGQGLLKQILQIADLYRNSDMTEGNFTCRVIDAIQAAPLQSVALSTLTDEQIDEIANDGCRNAAGGIYATRVYEFARAILAASAPAQHPKTPAGYKLVMVPNEAAPDEPDWEECKRQAELAIGMKVEPNTFSILKREVRRWIAHKSATPQPVAAEGLTGDSLIRSAQALLNLDANGALVPHGIGGHARTIIQAFINQEAMK